MISYPAFVWFIASVYYYIRTQFFDDIETPLRDSLDEEQLQIREESLNQRRMIFFHGAAIGVVLLGIRESIFRMA